MPHGLKRFQQSAQSHFVTFTCYHRRRGFHSPAVYDLFVQVLEEMRCAPVGFQGGVILASAFLMVYLAGRYITFLQVSPKTALDAGEGIGAGAFVLVGFVGMLAGAAFLENVLPLGQTGKVFSAGTIPIINLSVGLEVGTGLLLVMWEFLEQALVVRA